MRYFILRRLTACLRLFAKSAYGGLRKHANRYMKFCPQLMKKSFLIDNILGIINET